MGNAGAKASVAKITPVRKAPTFKGQARVFGSGKKKAQARILESHICGGW